jgi:hypothetical protein
MTAYGPMSALDRYPSGMMSLPTARRTIAMINSLLE